MTKKDCVISVIIPVYNHEKYIEKAIKSVLFQKGCPSVEIIICNDASTDNSADIIKKYAKKYQNIYFINNHKNMGLQYNLKVMLEKSRGDYIAILEGDDYWNDRYKLKKQYEALKNNLDKLVCFTDVYLLDQKTSKLSRHEPELKKRYRNFLTIHDLIRGGNPTVTFSCCMYNRKILSLIPNSFYENSQNFVFLFNLYGAAYADIIFIKQPCTTYRLHEKAQWSSLSLKEKYIRMIENSCNYNRLFNNKYENDFIYFIYVLSNALVNKEINKKPIAPIVENNKTQFTWKLYKKLFSISTSQNHKVITIFGVKFKFRCKIK